jgi:hypothetical protein
MLDLKSELFNYSKGDTIKVEFLRDNTIISGTCTLTNKQN